MSEPWNLTEAQRLQFREAQIAAKLTRRIAEAEAELRAVAEQATAAYREYARLNRERDAKADEIRELRKALKGGRHQ